MARADEPMTAKMRQQLGRDFLDALERLCDKYEAGIFTPHPNNLWIAGEEVGTFADDEGDGSRFRLTADDD